MGAAIRTETQDSMVEVKVYMHKTPLATPGRETRRLRVPLGAPLVWVLGMLAADRPAYDRFTALVDRGLLILRMDGRKVGWWEEVLADGELALVPSQA